jgi:aspartyl-tRNA(Asn)/glutamyl-tRNA(Gln) amidotransferase subunit B
MLTKDNVAITIGLEIHSHINTSINGEVGQKLFSTSSNDSKEGIPNKNISLFDISIPGTLPQLNLFAIQQVVKTGLALNGKIPEKCEFDRKHYFYPDLSSGFQITQNFYPIIDGGYIILKNGKKIGIHHIHMEADAGQSSHKDNYSLINYNRAMVGLMEIVTEPHMESIEECIEFIKKIRLTMQYIKTCNGNMEEGNFRVDVNLSIRKDKSEPLGTRVEIKNLNSFKFIEEAIKYEVNRQLEVINSGKKVIQETRGFDSSDGTSYSMRQKETAPEYRYMWEPNIPPIIIKKEFVEKVRSTLEELPDEKITKYKKYNMEDGNIDVLLENFSLQYYFESLLEILSVEEKINNKFVIMLSNWLIGDLYGLINKNMANIEDYPKEYLINIIKMIIEEKISGKVGKTILEESFREKVLPEKIVEKNNLWQITDTKIIDVYIQEVLKEETKKIEEYKNTKDEKVFHYLTGCVIKKTKGKGAPELCKNRLNFFLIENGI